MASCDTDQVIVASMRHSPRAIQRVITCISGSGFAVDDVQYRRVGDRNAILVATVDAHLASRDFDHLLKLVDGTIDVLWAQPLSFMVEDHRGTGEFRIDSYEVASRQVDGLAVCQARVAVVESGNRRLGAGEGACVGEALIRAVEGATRLRGHGAGDVKLEVTWRWSSACHRTPAVVIVERKSPYQTGRAMGVGTDELDATAKALETLWRHRDARGTLQPA